MPMPSRRRFRPTPHDPRARMLGAATPPAERPTSRSAPEAQTHDDRAPLQMHHLKMSAGAERGDLLDGAQRSDYLGSPVWTSAMARWVGRATTAAREEELRLWREWWDDAYVVQRLRAQLDPLLLEPVLAWVTVARDEEGEPRWSVEQIARHFHMRAGALIRARRVVTRFVRAHYLPYDHPRPQRPAPAPAGRSAAAVNAAA